MNRLIALIFVGLILSGCGSYKRQHPKFRASHRPTLFMECDTGNMVVPLIDGGEVNGGTMHFEDDYIRLDFAVPQGIGNLPDYRTQMLLPDDPDNMLNTNFTVFAYDHSTQETGDIEGELFNVDEGYWALVQGLDNLLTGKLEEGYVLVSFDVGNNTLILFFENLIDSSDTSEEVIGVEHFVSTMLAQDLYADQLSPLAGCSYTPFPWED